MYYVVVLDTDPKSEKCALGLIMQAMYGDGLSLYRCRLEKGHKGPHTATGGGGHSKHAIHIRIQWTVGRNILAPVNWETGEEQD